MKYSNLTTDSNSTIKRFSHKSRHVHCNFLVKKIKYKNFLDFGTGDGQLFDYLELNNKKYFAYEPYKKMYAQFKKKKIKKVKLITNKKNLKKNYYDLITVNEVFEHLSTKNEDEVIKILKSISKKKSKIIISVPIEIGLSSFFKNIIRVISNQSHENLSISNFLKSILYMKINRGKKKYYKSHIGFNYLDLKKKLNKNFKIEEISYTPFDFFKSLLNSQIFLICSL